jgi:adenylylsulfate kinase
MKILFMGLPGAGKTYLSERVSKILDCAWYNADNVRHMANDWDFTEEGRVRQSKRMRTFADFEKSHNRNVICDFVCPTEETRKEFDADLVIWVNTIEQGRFENTNKVCVPPKKYDFEVTERLSSDEISQLADDIIEKGTV